MALIIFLLLLFTPLIEIFILIEIGSVIGAVPTIGLCILTALLGAALLRHQGIRTLQRARTNLDRGTVPALEMLEGVALAVGGLLLMTPGFFTDAIGFACLIPFTRRLLVGMVLKRVHIVYGPIEGSTRRHPPTGKGGAGGEPRVIEGEYQRRDDSDGPIDRQ